MIDMSPRQIKLDAAVQLELLSTQLYGELVEAVRSVKLASERVVDAADRLNAVAQQRIQENQAHDHRSDPDPG